MLEVSYPKTRLYHAVLILNTVSKLSHFCTTNNPTDGTDEDQEGWRQGRKLTKMARNASEFVGDVVDVAAADNESQQGGRRAEGSLQRYGDASMSVGEVVGGAPSRKEGLPYGRAIKRIKGGKATR